MQCLSCEKFFLIRKEDEVFYQKLGVPKPIFCPSCREERRMAWCNEGTLYFSKCELCESKVISQFSTNSNRRAYCRDCWWSDKWDPKSYALNYDFNQPFFIQLKKLLENIPHCHINTDPVSENSYFTHHAGYQKNCYMTFHCTYAEDCYYGYGIKKAKDCVDCHYCHESELCYECIDVFACYDLKYSQECRNTNSSSFLYDCIACNNCFMSSGLRNKEYYFFNQKLSKENYQKEINKIDFSSHSIIKELRTKFASLKKTHIRKNLQVLMTENSFGNNLYNSRDSYHCFDSSDLEFCAYCSQLQLGAKYCYDIYQFGINIESCYECAMVGVNIYNCYFCFDLIEQCSNLQYCLSCHSTKDCFGCFGLKKSRYCILNKQYSKEDYLNLKQKIITELKISGIYGSFLPPFLSPHAYNETIAKYWHPKLKAEAQNEGYTWQDSLPFPSGNSKKPDITDSITNVGDDVSTKILCCQKCSRDYRINKKELTFYKKNFIPIPRECFSCRRLRRHNSRDSRVIQKTNCSTCNAETTTTLELSRLVNCEECALESSI